MQQSVLERINQLAHKAKTIGLTEQEVEERDALRKQYLKSFRENMIGVMENVYIKEEDGTAKKVERKNKD